MEPERATQALHTCGRGFGDVAAGFGPAAKPSSPGNPAGAGSGGGQDPCQEGDGGSEIELGGGLVTPQVAGLAQTQLHQPGQAVLHGLAKVAIGCKSRTVLESTGGLQQGFLRVQTDLAPSARCRYPPLGRSGNPPWGSGFGPAFRAL